MTAITTPNILTKINQTINPASGEDVLEIGMKKGHQSHSKYNHLSSDTSCTSYSPSHRMKNTSLRK